MTSRRSRSRNVPAVARLVALLVLLPSCLDTHAWVQKEKPWNPDTIAETDRVRVERSDGRWITLEQPRIAHDERGEFLAGRESPPGDREVRIDLAAVRSLEVREVEPGRVAAGIAAGLVVVAAVVLFVLNPFLPSS